MLRSARRVPPRTGFAGAVATATAGLALLAACGTAPSAPGTTGGGPSSAVAGTPVGVNLTEYSITVPPQTFAPGQYTFVAHNTGHTVHALEITGPGVAGQQTGGLQPGQSGQLTVTLQGGSYELTCPVDDHKGMGMDTHITVGGSGSGSGSGGGSGGGASQPAVPPTAPSTGDSGGGYNY